MSKIIYFLYQRKKESVNMLEVLNSLKSLELALLIIFRDDVVRIK